MLSFIDKWYDKIKPFIFKYKDGFFELPYVGNSPLHIIESFKKMPFITHHDDKKYIVSKSPFIDATVYYHVISDKLILMYSKLIIKQNVSTRSNDKKELGNDYYNLTFTTNLENNNASKRIILGEHLEKTSVQFLKPGVHINTYHFKGSNFISLSIYFKQEWLNKYLLNNNGDDTLLREFLESDKESIIFSLDNPENQLQLEFFKLIEQEFEKLYSKRDHNELEKISAELINYYKSQPKSYTSFQNFINITNNDRLKLKEVENILLENLKAKFPGVSYLAQTTGLSETKLKNLFKLVYQKTLLEFFQENQMQLAYKILENSNIKVSDLASEFGYANASKFSATFKSITNCLPSDVNTQSINE